MNLLRENQNFRWLFTATMVNRFGDSIDALTSSWLMYTVTQSASASALNFAINYIPTVLFQPLCGAWVVHHDPKKVMIAADAIRTGTVLLLAVLVFSGTIQGWMIYLTTFLISTVEAFRVPCGSLVNVSVLEKEDYSAGASLMTSASSLVQLIGSAAAGTLLSLAGIGVSLCIDALCFGLSAFFQTFLHFSYTPKEEEKDKNTIDLFREGLAYIRKQRFIITLTAMSVLVNALTNPIHALSSAWCQTVFQKGAWAISYINVFVCLGLMAGAVIYPRWIEKKTWLKRLIIETYLACAVFYLSWLAGGWLKDSQMFYLVTSILPFLTGIMLSCINIRISVVLMSVVDKHYLSRVDGILNAAVNAGVPVSSLITSALAAVLPLQKIFILFAFLSMLTALFCSFVKISREY